MLKSILLHAISRRQIDTSVEKLDSVERNERKSLLQHLVKTVRLFFIFLFSVSEFWVILFEFGNFDSKFRFNDLIEPLSQGLLNKVRGTWSEVYLVQHHHTKLPGIKLTWQVNQNDATFRYFYL